MDRKPAQGAPHESHVQCSEPSALLGQGGLQGIQSGC